MQDKRNLTQLIDDLKMEHSKQQFSESQRHSLFCEMNRLIRFAQKHGYRRYTIAIGERFKEFRCGRKVTDDDRNLRPFQMSCRLHIRILNYYSQTGEIPKFIKKEFRFVPMTFRDINDSFLEFQKTQISPSSWMCCKRHTYRFLCFIDEIGITNVGEITGETISKYCRLFADYDNCTIHTYLCDLRSFLRYLYEYEFVSTDLTTFVPKFRLYQDAHIPTTWSPNEISKLLAAIGRTDPIGKRDYAMILLIVTLGLRIGDVINLKFSNLDWRTMKISLIQKKNLEHVELPLQKDVAWAIIDYLKNGRPKNNSEYVFLKHINPIQKFSEHNSFWVVFIKYLKQAGLPRKPRGTAHSMRHSLASRMLDEKSQLSDIADVLGHSNVKSTIGYLKVSINDLRKCCLSFSGKRG